MSLLAEEERDDLLLVNALRDDVRRWRESNWENASETTKKLLRQWWREDALLTLAGEWKQKLEQVTSSAPGQDRTPPVMIVVCDTRILQSSFTAQFRAKNSSRSMCRMKTRTRTKRQSSEEKGEG